MTNPALVGPVLPSMIHKPLLRKVYRLAEAAAPSECCGYLADGELFPCENVQDRLRMLAPKGTTGDSRHAFHFRPDDAIRLSERVEAGNSVVIYHSHPDGDAVWSRSDILAAQFAGRVLYPQADRLVIGLTDGIVITAKLFKYSCDRFEPICRFDRAGEMIVNSVSAVGTS